MRVIPVVLERALLAGLLGLPALGVLGVVAAEGDVGLLTAALTLVAALVYVAVVWLLGLRRSLAAQAAAARPAPPEAVVEPLGLTALRSGAKALLGLALAFAATTVGLGPGAVVVVCGFSLVTALAAARLRGDERRAGHRLVRMKGEPGALRAF